MDRRFLLATLLASLLAVLLTAGSASAVTAPVPASCVGGALSAADHSSSTALAAVTESVHRYDGPAQHARAREASLNGVHETEPVRHARLVTWDRAGAAIFRLAADTAGAGARGLSKYGGIFSSSETPAGGTLWTATGKISQNDFAGLVNSGLMKGDVNIISGVHGAADGTTVIDRSLYEADVQRFGGLPGVHVYNYPDLTASDLSGLVNGPGTTIAGFCDSGACVVP